ncbi:accessory factor UbiK family protein [Parapusillimonas sp. SGNA-6]|jgi:BMFP domain-containing protein YqiC|nr:accessory factor UbiK family protein [Parapusillimonas sp. SGNA-6]
MIDRNEWFADFQKNISDLIAKSPAADIERNVKAVMAQTFSRLELVTREEFDVQVQLLEKALARIAALEARVQALEGQSTPPRAAASTTTSASSGTASSDTPDIPPGVAL